MLKNINSHISRNYRRVQRASGEMVWRCANRVEHGNRICRSSPTITEKDATQFVCKTLDIPLLDQQIVRSSLEKVMVNQDGIMTPEHIYADPVQKMFL